MKMVITILVVFVLLSVTASSQDTLWTRTYGTPGVSDIAHDFYQTSDSGYIIIGTSMESALLIKLDLSCDSVWAQRYGSLSHAWDAQETSDGGYIIVGHKYLLNPDAGIIRTDSIGDTLWTRFYNFGSSSGETIEAVKETYDSNFMLVGYSGSYYRDYLIMKIDSTGDTLWANVFGGNYHQQAHDVEITADSNYVITGLAGDYGNWDCCLFKMDGNGNINWQQIYQRSGDDYAQDVTVINDGFILSGNASVPGNSSDLYVIRTDLNGDTVWTKTFGGYDTEAASSIIQTPDGGFLVAGYTHSFGAGDYDLWILRLSAWGDSIYSKIYGGVDTDLSCKILRDGDGTYTICGSNKSLTGDSEYWLLKFRDLSVWYVSETGSDIYGYGTYDNPFRTIQFAIDATAEGDTVLVLPGIYIENINFSGQNIVLGSLFLVTGDTSYISQTIIDGDSTASVVTFESGEDSTAVIAGLTIRHGYSEYGGGIYVYSSSPTIKNNLIKDNISGDYGGGCFFNNSNSKIFNNKFMDNIAFDSVESGYGGGIYADSSDLIIESNNFRGNYAYGYYGGDGGGICLQNSFVIISDNLINENDAGRGGGICCHYSECQIELNQISSNSATSYGGGIFCHETLSNVSYNNLKLNYAAARGGGMHCWLSNSTLNHNTIRENSANHGGGLCTFLSPSDTAILINNTITRNTASNGGGIFDNGLTIIVNTIIWDNSYPNIFVDDVAPQITYSDIEGGWPGGGNIDCDPLFCSPDSDDFSLNEYSCCISAGQGGADIGALEAACCLYYTGDINGSGGYNGLDITFGVAYLKGGQQPEIMCDCGWGLWYLSGDVNGSCSYDGLDITYGVSYFKGEQTELFFCPDCPPPQVSISDLK